MSAKQNKSIPEFNGVWIPCNFRKIIKRLILEIAHNKYKRCLAMAEWCDAESDVADADGDYEDMRWYQKWHERWLELAEYYKED